MKGEPYRFLVGHCHRKHQIVHEVVDLGYETSCWRWLGYMMDNGYGSLKLDNRNWLAHRYYYTQRVGPIPDGFEIDHLCRNRCCVNPEHLEAVAPVENKRRSRSTKLTRNQVIDIRGRDATEMNKTIAAEFGVDPSTISVIRAGRTHRYQEDA